MTSEHGARRCRRRRSTNCSTNSIVATTAFTDVELDVAPLDVGGDYACVEWTVQMTHSGTTVLADDMTIEPSGIRVTLHGVTIAEFLGDRICSVRQYWDEHTVLEQLGVLRRNA